jgi:diguanylate cyclase (GGDEF)-like protein
VLKLLGYRELKQIYDGNNSQVFRVQRLEDGQPAIVKVLKAEYPTPEQLRRYHQEYNLAHQLRLPGAIAAYGLEEYQRTLAIVFEDFEAIALREWVSQSQPEGRLSITTFLPIAIKIAESLGQLHNVHIIHKDINPANIVLNPNTGVLKIIDFGISTQLSRENPTLENPTVLEGTLAYISPEQTGRMNRSVDYRTDFYSLGVTFYELLTGQLPFTNRDPLELVHAHLAKTATPVCNRQPEIPQAISDIVAKLMGKNAEDRYQSASGLKADLETCLEQLERMGEIWSFAIGMNDVPDRFQIPQKLYGREQEIATLLAAFTRTAENPSNSPNSKLILVTGYSGIGKSSLVQELYKPITEKRGYFTSGKFDQFHRNIPYSALVEAFTKLVRQLLSETQVQLQQWRDTLLTALGNNGQVIVDVIPDVELIVGAQPSVPDLGAMEAQNRFNQVFQSFLRALCSREHPLVIFLDDLQWADLATLKLMERIIADSQIAHLLIIGAYRDNEVTVGHPLAIAISQIRQTGVEVEQIDLAPLQLEQVTQLLGETLHCTPKAVGDLAELVMQKTGGNPFFINEFLKTLYSENLLTFNRAARNWQWHLAGIRAKEFTDNVVDLILVKMQKLPTTVQEVLSLAACLGTKFDLESLKLVEGRDRIGKTSRTTTAIFSDLKMAMEQELLLPRSRLDPSLVIQSYQFAHDRIQQAAYALIPEQDQAATHLHIGRLLLSIMDEGDLGEKLFDIIDQLNQGIALVSDEAERERLARLNLQAGRKANRAAAYSSAIAYLDNGLALLSETAWASKYELCLALHDEAVKAAFLNGNTANMDRLSEIAISQAKTPLDRVNISAIKIEAYGTQGRLGEAIATGLDILAQLRVEFPQYLKLSDFSLALKEVQTLVDGRQASELVNLPEMSDPEALAALQLLIKLGPAAFISLPILSSLISLKQVVLSVTYGNAPLSAVAYASYGLVLCGVVGDFHTGYQYGQLSLDWLARSDSKEFEATVLMLVHSFINHWQIHLRETLEPLQRAHTVGLVGGDFAYSGFAGFDYCTHAYLIGKPLLEIQQDIQHYIAALKQMGQFAAFSYLQCYQQAVLNLIDNSPHPSAQPYELTGTVMDEQEAIALFQHQNNHAGLWHLYTAKLPICYLFEEFAIAREVSSLAHRSSFSGTAGVAVPILYFYESLSYLALWTNQPEEDQLIQAHLQQLEQWSQAAPMNYQHKLDLVKAEHYRVLGQKLEAIESYEQAIAGAKAHGYIQEEALANELAAKFFLKWDKETIARAYMMEARYGYLRWGAIAKVKHLEAKYPQLCPALISTVSSQTSTHTTGGTSSSGGSAALDLAAAIKSSQAISSEIVLESLLQTLMKLLLESAGAQTGSLILHTPVASGGIGDLALEAQGSVEPDMVTVVPSQPLDRNLPKSVIYYVARSQESLVLDRPAIAGNFIHDSYIKSTQPQSILCYPLLNRGQLVGIVYLENNLTPGAFTPKRIELLQLLSSQAAISIENAKLYANLEQKVAERTAELAQLNQELQRLASVDGLTQVANRRQFDLYLNQEWQRHLRDRTTLALILVDIDYFKRYNDHYGHQGGDDCLVKVARAMAETMKRSGDLVARYGGEEFAVVLPNTDAEGARTIAESIRASVQQLAILHAGSDVSPFVTLSLGVASCIPSADGEIADLIAAADAALYRSKQNGRDRVTG